MQEVIIDDEFRDLLPELDAITYGMLEENIIQNGCRDSLVLWGDILIDGHNRYKICMEHDIPFNTVRKDFDSREEALIWIISTQVSRRNLLPIQLAHYRGLHYRADKKIQGTNNQFVQASEKLHKPTFQGSTAVRLGRQYNVSRDTIIRDAKISEAIEAIGEISPEAKRIILSGKEAVEKKVLEALSSESKEELTRTAEAIENGEFKKKKAAAKQHAEQGEPAGLILAGMRTLNSVIRRGDKSEWKPALRVCIDLFEDMYQQI